MKTTMKMFISTINVTISFNEDIILVRIKLNAFHFLESLKTLRTRIALNAVSAPPEFAPKISNTIKSIIERHTINASNRLNLSREYSFKPRPTILMIISTRNKIEIARLMSSKILTSFLLLGYRSIASITALIIVIAEKNRVKSGLCDVRKQR